MVTTILGIAAGLIGTTLSAIAGVKVRNWLIERRIKSNPDMKIGAVFFAIYREHGDVPLLKDCYLASMAGNRVVFVSTDGYRRLSISNSQFGKLWLVRAARKQARPI